MSDSTNPHFVSALAKLVILGDDYQNHPNAINDTLWDNFKNDFDLTLFEVGALKYARCPPLSQPPQAGKY